MVGLLFREPIKYRKIKLVHYNCFAFQIMIQVRFFRVIVNQLSPPVFRVGLLLAEQLKTTERFSWSAIYFFNTERACSRVSGSSFILFLSSVLDSLLRAASSTEK